MTDQVDTEARINSMKALTIVFLLAIIAANSLLIFKFIRQGRLQFSQRRFIILTLAGGDILIALFPLVVAARGLFEEYFDCQSSYISKVYQYWFLPFVYGVALVTLCGELIKRKWIRSTISNSGLASIFLAAIPWISALVLVLPLGIAGFNSHTQYKCYFDSEFTKHRMRACYIIGAIIPSCVAVIAAVWTSSRSVSPESEVFERTNFNGGTVISVPSSFPQSHSTYPVDNQTPATQIPKNHQELNCTETPQGALPPSYDVATQQGAPSSFPQSYSTYPVSNQTYPVANPTYPVPNPGYPVPNPNYPVANPSYPVPNPNYPVPNPNYPVANPTYPITQPTYQPAPQAYHSTTPFSTVPHHAQRELNLTATVQHEQKTLVVVAIASAILTLPLSFFMMCYGERIGDVDRMDPVPEVVLADLCYWLLCLRSVVVPLIWLSKSRVPV